MIKMNQDRAWLLQKAAEEDNAIVSVGGLSARIAVQEKLEVDRHCEMTHPSSQVTEESLGLLVFGHCPVLRESRMGSDWESDEDILQHLRRGEASAFKAAYDRYSRVLFAFVGRIIVRRGDVDGEDGVQEVFFRLYTHCETITGNNLRAWLYQTARNWAIDMVRRGRTRLTAFGKMVEQESPEFLGELPDPLLQAEQDERVRVALDDLGDTDRKVIRLRMYEGMSNAESGKVLGCSENAAKCRFYDGMRRLREAYIARFGEGDAYDN